VSLHGRASRAQHDPASDDVVGVRNGEFLRIDTDTGSETVVADLLDRPAEAEYDAVFVEADDGGGWWIGLGDGDYELATTLRVLVHVDANGSVERWPVHSPPESVYGADLTNGQLTGDGFALAVPAPGSSAGGTAVTADITDSYSRPLVLADGRSLRTVTNEGSSTVELLAEDGDATTLQNLLEARYVVAVPGGPTVEPIDADRTLTVPFVVSPWITPDGEPAFDSTTTPVEEDPSVRVSADDLPIGGADDQRTPQEPATGVSESTSSGSEGRPWIVVLSVAGVIAYGAATFLLAARRRRVGSN